MYSAGRLRLAERGFRRMDRSEGRSGTEMGTIQPNPVRRATGACIPQKPPVPRHARRPPASGCRAEVRNSPHASAIQDRGDVGVRNRASGPLPERDSGSWRPAERSTEPFPVDNPRVRNIREVPPPRPRPPPRSAAISLPPPPPPAAALGRHLRQPCSHRLPNNTPCLTCTMHLCYMQIRPPTEAAEQPRKEALDGAD
jgi:hypothetical protein